MAFSNLQQEFGVNPLMEGHLNLLPNAAGNGTGSPSSHTSGHSSLDVILSPQEEVFGGVSSLDQQQLPAPEVEDEEGDWKFFETLPPGYRFCPTDSDLIVHYLMKKMEKKKLPRNQIRHINLYQYSPEKIAEIYKPVGEKEWYFFTPRDRKYRNGFRPNRAAGSGYWKATGADKNISYKGKDVGCRKALVYYEGKPPKGSKTNWIMHEYRLDTGPKEKTREKMEKAREKMIRENSGSNDNMRLDDFVLCRIYKKVDKSFKPRTRSVDEDVASPLQNYDYNDQEGSGLFDDQKYNQDYLLDEDFKGGGTEFMQAHINSNGFGGFNGFSDVHHHGFSDVHHHSHSLPMNYGAKPLYFRQTLPHDDASLDIKPLKGGFYDNTLWSNCDIRSLPHPEDFNIPELDSLLNSSYEIPTLNADGPSMSN